MSNAKRSGQLLLRRYGALALAMLLAAASLLAMLAPVRALADDEARTPEYATWDDFSGKTVGMVTGATFESALREKCPDLGKAVYYS